MSRIQSKKYFGLGNVISSQERRQPTYANPKMIQMLELSDRLLGAILIMFQEINVNTLEMNRKIDVLGRDKEPMKKKQVKILELKNTVIKSILCGLGGGMEVTKESYSELDDIDIVQSKEQREKRLNKKMNRA